MSRPEPVIAPLAWGDLDMLLDVVSETSGSMSVAAQIYEGVLSSIEAVAAMPLSAPSVAARTGIPCDYRWTAYKGWLAFYHVKEDGGILVDRVLWGRSEWARALDVVE